MCGLLCNFIIGQFHPLTPTHSSSSLYVGNILGVAGENRNSRSGIRSDTVCDTDVPFHIQRTTAQLLPLIHPNYKYLMLLDISYLTRHQRDRTHLLIFFHHNKPIWAVKAVIQHHTGSSVCQFMGNWKSEFGAPFKDEDVVEQCGSQFLFIFISFWPISVII